ncbi:MAG: Peptidoglycan glycosyltransferase [Acidobacteria bacterium]|nr:Peptidoglycan glycosyltransferase [Acidobacteriota bacterium]
MWWLALLLVILAVAAGLRVRDTESHQRLAAEYLIAGKTAAAKPHLEALRGRTIWLSAIPKEEVARKLFAANRYADFLSYDAASRDRAEVPDVVLYRAAANVATNRLDAAEAAFRSLDRGRVDARKATALGQAIAERKAGNIPYVFDRTGAPIAVVRLPSNEVAATDPEYAALIEKDAGELTVGANAPRLGTNATLDTTLDPAVQRAAIAALGVYRGSLVAIDPRTNELLAIASSRGQGKLADLALESQYEPGSVIKVLTGLNAYNSGFDPRAMFPYDCKGDLLIDGRHFGDWLGSGHGVLPSLDEALAESCNIVFADVGLRLGADRLRTFMTAAGFDSQTDLGIATAPLGKTVGQIFNRYETAFYAIGLEHESINALHLAMLASMLANRGTLAHPRLLRGRRSILGESTAAPAPPPPTRIASKEAAEQMVRAMEAVVTSPKGTGRRAAIEGLTIAMKTGTAGKRENGYQALIVCFAPAEQPTIAFGLIAESAGPAEYAGAKIAHDFLVALRAAHR